MKQSSGAKRLCGFSIWIEVDLGLRLVPGLGFRRFVRDCEWLDTTLKCLHPLAIATPALRILADILNWSSYQPLGLVIRYPYLH